MKRMVIVSLAMLFVASVLFCQEINPGTQPPADKKMRAQGMQPGMMRPEMGRGMQQRMMNPGMGPMGNMMPPTYMVASDNGGVIILSGNRLMKFDKNLKLIKEVELLPGDKNKQGMPCMQPGMMKPGTEPGMQPPAEKK